MQQAIDAFHQVVYITEAAGLAAVAKDRKVFSPKGLADEGRQRATVVETHPGAISIEDPDDTCFQAVEIMIGHGHGFLKPFRFIVHTTGPDGVYITPIFFRLRVNQRIAIDLRGRGDEHPRLFRLGKTQTVVGAQRADLQCLDGYFEIVDRTGG